MKAEGHLASPAGVGRARFLHLVPEPQASLDSPGLAATYMPDCTC